MSKSDFIEGIEHAIDRVRWWRREYQRGGDRSLALAAFAIEDDLQRTIERERIDDGRWCRDGSGIHAPAIDGHCPDCGHAVEDDQ